jgi:glutamate formiminotransferase / 5-formyltetrahydrofolate cyclo-ligase
VTALIECVPNISEGRRSEVIAEFVDALSSVPGVTFLDQSSDADHNRSVFTFVGSPAGLTAAVRQLFSLAVKHIDLRAHRGGHPRMGAVDVVPFIPIRGATMKDCAALSRQVAETISTEFEIPTFLYGESTKVESRKVLSIIRKGEFEGMAEKMLRPEWKADFGPVQPHISAGVSAIGSRFFLIAYNLQLDTPDINIANAIAKAVRGSSGGLVNVQGMGVFLTDRNQAQVSMNLLNYEKTPIHRVQELVKVEAARYGVRVVGGEIVGLIPQAALLDAAAYYLQIENWNRDLVLENAVLAKQAPVIEKA